MPEVHSMIEGYIEQANGTLERWETVKRFGILPNELTVEAGDVTPSLKIKRRQVESKYADRLDALYED
jgi:long-chain acyl-CoA synthetase